MSVRVTEPSHTMTTRRSGWEIVQWIGIGRSHYAADFTPTEGSRDHIRWPPSTAGEKCRARYNRMEARLGGRRIDCELHGCVTAFGDRAWLVCARSTDSIGMPDDRMAT